ncbi:MAG TPA: endonuclease/exonuclease/phosphatase family protein [Streptosporangiaceae bacterium]|jgi:endonuclease/exonuclease/phosphatase family metal-dependent hydrolase|nr:endonuclease/exonuclease/phosphatase family protein [Streptosporangiaceae bacterium]
MPEVTGAVEDEKASPLRPRRRRLTGVRLGLYVIGWLVVAGLGLLALLRVVAWDDAEILMVFDALYLTIYLPAWVVAAVALIARRWWLGGAALVVVAAQVAFALPELTAATPLPAWTRNATTIRVFDANLDSGYQLYPGYQQAIKQYDPDLITFEEFSGDGAPGFPGGAIQTMQNTGLLNKYRYYCSEPDFGATGFMLASRIRVTGCQFKTVQWNGQGMYYLVEATMWLPSGPIPVRVLHTLAPLPSSWTETRSALAAADRMVKATGASHMLMIGDFNSSWGNRGFRRLLGDGLTDGAAARGQAFDFTWPNGAIVPPFVRIDHVLTGSHLAVTKISAHQGFGSDHKYLETTVAIQR